MTASKNTKTTIQMTQEDIEVVRKMCDLLSAEHGFKIGLRVGVLIAVNRVLRELEK